MREPRPTADAGSQATRERLLLAAERLFARKGIDAVSLRQINVEAGQRNVSALHYHFGSREALIEAIFAYRMRPVNRRRNELLDQLAATGRTTDLRAVVSAAIWPLAEQLLRSANSGSHVRFLAQAHRWLQADSWRYVRRRNLSGLARAYVMVLRAVDELPREIVHARAFMMLRQVIYMLADLDRAIIDRHPDLRDEMVHYHVGDMIDLTVGALCAPVSQSTLDAGRVLGHRATRHQAAMTGIDALQGVAHGPTTAATTAEP